MLKKITILIVCLVPTIASASEELSVVVDGKNVIKIKKSESHLDKAVKYTADYLAELQETISFNQKLNKNFGLEISNERLLFPMGNGDFIVSDTTALTADFEANFLKNTFNELNVGLKVEGEARPSIRRFFVSSMTDSQDLENYSMMAGPQNLPTYYGVNDNLFDIGGGIQVDRLRYARYSNWVERLHKNITSFPFHAKNLDEMAIGEGYAVGFEGVLALGPSFQFTSPLSTHFSAGAHFTYSKTLKSGHFELIIVKASDNKVLFSIRQDREVGADNFKISFGGKIYASLEAVLGSEILGGVLPTRLKVLEFGQDIQRQTEERFNAVYQLDLDNTSDRNIYNKSLSTFDFSLFDIFTFDSVKNSHILSKFRNSDIKLLLDSQTRARVHTSTVTAKAFLGGSYKNKKEKEVYKGTSKYEDREVDVAGGALSHYIKKSGIFGRGREEDEFEFKAYEEYGAEAHKEAEDILLMFRRKLLDANTENSSVLNGDSITNQELQDYIEEFNRFTNIPIKANIDKDKKNLETTQGLIEFYITRSDIINLQYFKEADLVTLILNSISDRKLDKRRKNYLRQTDPANWRARWGEGKLIRSVKNFILGFRRLKHSIYQNRPRLSVAAVNQMLSKSYHISYYAQLFRAMLIKLRVRPKINIRFSNSRLRIDYTQLDFKGLSLIRDGLQLQEELEKTLSGKGFYDDIHETYVRNAVFNKNGVHIRFNGQREFQGFVKINLKRSYGGGDSTLYESVGEFIIDLTHYKGHRLSFRTKGMSSAESHFRRLLPQADKIFLSISLDNRIYDAEVEL